MNILGATVRSVIEEGDARGSAIKGGKVGKEKASRSDTCIWETRIISNMDLTD